MRIPSGYALDDRADDYFLRAPKRAAASRALAKVLDQTYFPYGVPMDEIQKALRAVGIVVVMEDDTEWEGVFLGREGSSLLRLGDLRTYDRETHRYTKFTNAGLALQWYKLRNTYEVTGYIS